MTALGASALALLLVSGCGSATKHTSTATTTPSAGGGSTTTTASGTTAATGTVSVPSKYSGGINVAMDATYPPDEMVDNGQITGFNADLVKALGQQMGVPVKLTNATFDGIIPGLLSGKYDLGASSFTDNKAREQQVDFVTYFSSGEGFYVKSDSTATFASLDSLCNHSVAVESGTTEETDAKAQAAKCKVDVQSFSDQNQANLAVSSGRADAGFLDSQVAGYVVKVSNGQFKLVGQPFSTAPYGFAVAKNSGLTAPLLAALKSLIANGQYTQILTKWGAQSGAITDPQINGATS